MSTPGDSEWERRLDEIIAAYLQAVDAGDEPDRQELLRRHPDLAESLREFFEDEDRFGRVPSTGEASRPVPAVPVSKGGDSERLVLRPAEARRERFSPGTLLAGHYRIFDMKAGGMGRVYFAEDLELKTDGAPLKVAIKTVPDFTDLRETRAAKGLATDEALYTNLVARFRREAIGWVRLGLHPNIIMAMWVIDVGAKPYLVMEYADGGDLREWIRSAPVSPPYRGETMERSRRLTIPLAVNFAIQICRGMQHAVRTAGLVHRDLKPANLLIKDNLIIKIADFGLAKAYDPESPSSPRPLGPGRGEGTSDSPDLSALGAGTRAYMAPEQFRSLHLADTRSDIFSFGVVLYEMLTGVQPFARIDSYKMSLLGEPVGGPHELNATVPPELSRLVTRCVAYDPKERCQSFHEVGALLERIADALPDSVPLPNGGHAAPPPSQTPTVRALGEAYSLISLGQYAEAAERAQVGIDVDPDNYEHWTNKGVALLHLEHFDDAHDCFVRASRLSPKQALTWSNLASAMLGLGDPMGALTMAAYATELAPEFTDGWIARGNCERELGRLESASRCYERAAQLSPHHWLAHMHLGFCLAALGRKTEAVTSLTRAVQINPRSPGTWFTLGSVYSRMGGWKAAHGAVDLYLSDNPDDANAWILRGWVLKGCGEVPAARASANKALALAPDNSEAKRLLDAIWIETGSFVDDEQNPSARHDGQDEPRGETAPDTTPLGLLVQQLTSDEESLFLDGLREATSLAAKGNALAVESLEAAIRAKSPQPQVTFYQPGFVVRPLDDDLQAPGEILDLARRHALLHDVRRAGQLITAVLTVHGQARVGELAFEVLHVGGPEEFYNFQLLFNQMHAWAQVRHARHARRDE